MRVLVRSRFAQGGVAVIASLALFAGACGDDDGDDIEPVEPSPTVSAAGASVPSSGSVAPNTFLTFDGQRYRLVELLQADLIDDSVFE